jgi:hypothetical protein
MKRAAYAKTPLCGGDIRNQSTPETMLTANAAAAPRKRKTGLTSYVGMRRR